MCFCLFVVFTQSFNFTMKAYNVIYLRGTGNLYYGAQITEFEMIYLMINWLFINLRHMKDQLVYTIFTPTKNNNCCVVLEHKA